VHTELPAAAAYLPVSQLVHDADPIEFLYFPATHCVHVPPFDPDEPALQVQAVSAGLAAGEFEYAGQDTHTSVVAPIDVEYLPVPQSVHVLP
jgi:hypothetical protein